MGGKPKGQRKRPLLGLKVRGRDLSSTKSKDREWSGEGAQMRIQFSCSLPDLLEERPALKNESFPRGMMHCLHHFMCFAQKSIGFLEFLLRIPLSPTMVFSPTLGMAHVFTAVCFYTLITEPWGPLRAPRIVLLFPHWKENPPVSETKDGKV